MRVEAFVVGAQRVEDIPDDLESAVIRQCLRRAHVGGDGDGEDDVAVVFAFGFAHHATD
ncbi:Uncharacterised protein [Mycobacteroides abscessus subsp. massiliense]|nr:Uncharacterised protein [Mycobacteroides abscessus subsp. massiliense]